MQQCVLVTDKEFIKAKAIFESAKDFDIKSVPTEETALAEAILADNCRAVIIGVDNYTGPLYEALGKTGGDKGAVISRFGVGTDGVNKDLARKHNICITNTPGVLDQSVAEHAIWLMGALVRNVVRTDAEIRTGEFGSPTGTEVGGKTLGIIGFGAIGRRVAKIAHFGLNMKVIAFDICQLDTNEIDSLKSDFGIDMYTDDLDSVLGQSDIISVHLPSVTATHHFFNADRFGCMKSGSILLNSARGPIVDECALYDALSSDQLAGAALDVFEQEPYAPVALDKDLRTLKNVVLTPHIGSNTRECNIRMANACLQNLERWTNEML